MPSDERLCKHCGGEVRIRNPTGKCDHLYWPENLTDEAKRANGIPIEISREELERKATRFDALLAATKTAHADMMACARDLNDEYDQRDVRSIAERLHQRVQEAEKP